jgi:GNAT superfamily N-acetyltransferase
LVAFIVRPYSEEILAGTIDAYIDSFAGPPWFERWEPSQVEKIIRQATEKEGFIGRAVLSGEYVIGASMGYKVPRDDTETVKFSRIYPLLDEIGWQDAFYGAETFIRQESQKKGIGTYLLKAFTDEEACRRVVFRTINPNQIRARAKAWNCKAIELFYDPEKTDRLWYGVIKNGELQ